MHTFCIIDVKTKSQHAEELYRVYPETFTFWDCVTTKVQQPTIQQKNLKKNKFFIILTRIDELTLKSYSQQLKQICTNCLRTDVVCIVYTKKIV